jgi:uncharacterized protein
MRLDLHEIIEVPGKSVPFDRDIESDNLEFDSVKRYLAPLHVNGQIYNEAGVLRLIGEVKADMLCICDRCGAEFESEKVTQLDAVIAEEENEENPELFILEDDGIDLDEVVSTCFILDMETKFLCREDCKGICPGCGVNLNTGTCTCKKQVDPRFAVLEQLLDKE